MKVPVAFLIFKRPDTTEKVFEAIRQARPPKLLVVADGPRADKPGEAEKCAATRAIIDRVDWDCEVIKHYADVNLGCKKCVSSGITWVFEQVEEAIILEDDCLPHPTFFQFCEELLAQYRDDQRIMSICGDNSRATSKRTEYSYYFSRAPLIWGWATWRRAWQYYYDVNMKLWPMIRDGKWHQDFLPDEKMMQSWEKTWQASYEGKIDTWDYQWSFACSIQSGMSVISNVNLISNLGFHAEATHTTYTESFRANNAIEAMSFPLKHPPFMIADRMYEESAFKKEHPNLLTRARKKAGRLLGKLIKS